MSPRFARSLPLLVLVLGPFGCGSERPPLTPPVAPTTTPTAEAVELQLNGERLDLVPAVGGALPNTSPVAVSFVGTRSAIVRSYEPLGVHGYSALPAEPRFSTVIELETLEGATSLTRRRLTDRPSSVLVVPGAGVVLAYADRLERRRFADGDVTARASIGGSLLAVDADGRLVVAIEGGAVILDRDLLETARLVIDGTASSVMRIYTGEYGPTYHDTVPIEVPAQVVSAAFGPGGRIALGTNDGAVHLVSDGGSTTRRVAIEVPGRPMEDYPHVAAPLALHFDDERTLHVATAYGAILAIDVDAATSRVLHPSTCAPEEIEGLLAPFPGDRREWTVRTYCEDAGAAAFSPDGLRLASRASLGLRVREVRTGAPLRTVLSNAPYGLAFRDPAHVALLDVYGEREEISLLDGSVSRDTTPHHGVHGAVTIYPGADLVLATENLAPEPPPPGREESPRPSLRVAAFHLDGTAYPFVRERLFVAASRASDRLATYDALSGTVEVTDHEGRVLFSQTGLGLGARYHGLGVSPDGATVLLSSDGLVQRVGETAVTELSNGPGVVERFTFGGEHVAFTRFIDAPWGYGLEVRTLSGAVRVDMAVGHDAFALSPDGLRLAYVDPATDAARVVVLREIAGAELRRLPLEGIDGMAITGDMLLWSGSLEGLMRRDGDGATVTVGVGALSLTRVTFGEETFVMEDGVFGAHVVRVSDNAHLATIHAIGGGFVVVSRRGAIDGSSAVASAFVTIDAEGRAREPTPTALTPLLVPGLLTRVLRGEDVAPSP